MGVEICPGVDPPREAFDALILYLCGNEDNLRWQIAAACNRYERRYRKQAYIMAASRLDCSPSTVAQWCHIERSVPYNARVPGLSIWFHKAVATVKDSYLQREYLETCKDGNNGNGWALSVFEEWLAQQGVEVEETHYQSDRQFEQEQEAYKLANEVTTLKQEKAELQDKLDKIVTSQERS